MFRPIVSAKAIVDTDTGRCKGYGFVLFEHEESARCAIESLSLRGEKVTYARPPKNADDPHASPQLDPTNLYVAHLPPYINEEKMLELLMEVLDGIGKVFSCRVLLRNDGFSRGIALARLDTPEACDYAIKALNGRLFSGWNHPLTARHANGQKMKSNGSLDIVQSMENMSLVDGSSSRVQGDYWETLVANLDSSSKCEAKNQPLQQKQPTLTSGETFRDPQPIVYAGDPSNTYQQFSTQITIQNSHKPQGLPEIEYRPQQMHQQQMQEQRLYHSEQPQFHHFQSPPPPPPPSHQLLTYQQFQQQHLQNQNQRQTNQQPLPKGPESSMPISIAFHTLQWPSLSPALLEPEPNPLITHMLRNTFAESKKTPSLHSSPDSLGNWMQCTQ